MARPRADHLPGHVSVVPSLKAEAVLSDLQASLFTSAVSIGFVFGTLTSAILTLSDRIAPGSRISATEARTKVAYRCGSMGMTDS